MRQRLDAAQSGESVREKNQTRDRDAALAKMREDLDKLAGFPSFPRAVWLRGVVLEVEGHEEKALEFWKATVDKSDPNPLHEYRYAMALYRSGEVRTGGGVR